MSFRHIDPSEMRLKRVKLNLFAETLVTAESLFRKPAQEGGWCGRQNHVKDARSRLPFVSMILPSMILPVSGGLRVERYVSVARSAKTLALQ